MKRQLKAAGIIILAVVLMLVVGINSFQTLTPTAVLVAPVAGIVAVSITVGLGTISGIVTTVLGSLGLLLLQSADWLLVLNFCLVTVFIGWLIGWRLPLQRKVTHQQLIWLGIVAGISELVLYLGQAALLGIATGADWLIMVRLALLPAILSALLYAVLVSPLAALWRWLARQILPPESSNDSPQDPHGPVEIDLSQKQKHDQK